MIKILKKYRNLSLVVGALTIAVVSGVSWNVVCATKDTTQVKFIFGARLAKGCISDISTFSEERLLLCVNEFHRHQDLDLSLKCSLQHSCHFLI